VSGSRVPIAFLFDVDNTLLNNDRVRRDLVDAINRVVGAERGGRFWELYEEIRQECDYVDFPHTLERFARIYPVETGFPALADAVLSYPYRSAAFPAAHEVLRHAGRIGPAAILTDGDPVYQPAKIARAGLAEEVSGRVFVFAHKELHLDEVAAAAAGRTLRSRRRQASDPRRRQGTARGPALHAPRLPGEVCPRD